MNSFRNYLKEVLISNGISLMYNAPGCILIFAVYFFYQLFSAGKQLNREELAVFSLFLASVVTLWLLYLLGLLVLDLLLIGMLRIRLAWALLTETALMVLPLASLAEYMRMSPKDSKGAWFFILLLIPLLVFTQWLRWRDLRQKMARAAYRELPENFAPLDFPDLPNFPG